MLKESKIVNVLISYHRIKEKKKEKTKSLFGNFFSFSSPKDQESNSINKALDLLAKKIYYLTDIPTQSLYITSDTDIDMFLEKLEAEENLKEVVFFPLLPQFSYEITGKLANLFYQRMSIGLFQKCLWIKSFSHHKGFIEPWQKNIQKSLNTLMWKEEETIFIFFAKKLKQRKKEDLFHYECLLAKRKILKKFPYVLGKLIDLNEITNSIDKWSNNRKNLLFIPISYLFDEEIPFQKMNPLFLSLQNRGYTSQLCPPLNLNCQWIHSICSILEEGNVTNSHMLIPPKHLIG